MTEILTESFCERCGTRYTFESAAPRQSRLARVRTMSRGLRNYVLQDDSSFSEAMADARSEDERTATAHQLDAFHKTFNFCMTCRQYTCGNCWNVEDGRCLTCAPTPESELALAEAAAKAAADQAAADQAAADQAAAAIGVEAWPEADLGADRLARALGMEEAEAAAVEATAIEAAADAGLEPAGAWVHGLTPGQSVEDAVAAFEARVAAQEAADLETRAAAEAAALEAQATEAAAASELEVRAAAEAAAAAAAAATAELEARAAADAARAAELAATAGPPPAPEPSLAVRREDLVAQPSWPVAEPVSPTLATPPAPPGPPAPPQPAEPAAPANPWLTVAPDDGAPAEPQWPIAAQWGRTTRTDMPTTLAGRQLLPRDDAASVWAASAREVQSGGPGGGSARPAAAPAPLTPQPCVSCGLSLSASARFCRRCGTRQG